MWTLGSALLSVVGGQRKTMANNKTKKKQRNAQQKKKTSKRASGPKRPKTTRPTVGGPTQTGSLVHRICSITDPWCAGATGCKYPDDDTTKTLSWQVDEFVTITSDINGKAACFISSNPGANLVHVNAWSGTLPSTVTGGFQAPGWSAFAGSGAQWRCVSLGVEFNSILSAMNNSGEIGCAVIPPNLTQTQVLNFDINNANGYAQNERTGASQGKTMVAFARNNGVSARDFKNPSGTSSPNVNSDGTEVLYVYYTGAAVSQQVIGIRIKAHYELIFPINTVFNQMATPAAVEDPIVTAGKNYVASKLQSVFTGGVAAFEGAVVRAATEFANRRTGPERLQ